MSYADEARERVRELKARGHAVILAVESSCDETAMALVADGRRVLSGEIASQVDTHALYGGVVPEIASRMHVERWIRCSTACWPKRDWAWTRLTRWA